MNKKLWITAASLCLIGALTAGNAIADHHMEKEIMKDDMMMDDGMKKKHDMKHDGMMKKDKDMM